MLSRKQLPILLTLFGLVALNIAVAGDDTDRPYLGIAFNADEAGVQVTRVFADSPAAQVGLQAGDIITAVNGESVAEDTLVELVQSHAVSDTLALTVTRGSEDLELSVTLAARPQGQAVPFFPQAVQRPYLGVRLENTDQGVLISEVVPESPAALAGLQAGDILHAIGNTEINTAQDATQTVQAMNPGDTVTLEIDRNGESLSLEATLGSAPQPSAVFPPEAQIPGDIIIYNSSQRVWQIRGLTEDSPLY